MNAQDMKDTFIHPAFNIIFSTDTTTQQAGTYFLKTSTTLGTGTDRSILVSTTPVFIDTTHKCKFETVQYLKRKINLQQ